MNFRFAAVAILTPLLYLVGGPKPASAQLNGNYTIGTVPSDYLTIAAAVTDLHTDGIDGPVNFQIKPGTYDEQITISYFERFGDPDDLVTFEPLSGTVTWQASAATAGVNHVVRLDSASYIKFDDLDIEAVNAAAGRLISIQNVSSHITISNSRLAGILGAINASSLVFGSGHDIVIEDNIMSWGREGIWMNFTTPNVIEKYTIRRNSFGGQTEYGILLTDADTAFVGLNTVISAAWSDADFTGIRVSFVDFARITRNTVDMQRGNEGISMSGGSGGTGSRVANNMVALRYSAATSPIGIKIDADNVDVYHNTVRTTQTTGEALKVTSSASSVSVLNNIFAADGGGLAMYVEDEASVDSSDYNILYSSGTHITQWEFMLNAGINDHREDSRRDFASYKAAVTFVSTTGSNDLHLAAPSDSDIRLIGPPRSLVVEDIDGDPRTNYTVTRGADEGQPFSPLDDGDTTLGYYTAGGSSPDFATPALALRHLRLRGMKGPVTIRVRAGTYAVQRIIDPERFLGSDTDTVLIRASDPANRPLLQVSSGSTFQNYALRIVDQTAIQIRNIDFEAIGTPPFGRLIVLTGDVEQFKLTKCSLTGFAGETSTEAALVYGAGSDHDEVNIANCSFNGGSFGAWLATTSGSARSEDSSIKKSRFDDQAVSGIYSNQTRLLVEEDTITSSRDDFVGIHIAGAINPEVLSTAVHATGTGAIGLLLDGGFGSFSDLAPIHNNFLNGRHAGLVMQNGARYYGVFHNTIRGQDYGLFVDANAGISGPTLYFSNNIIINSGTDPALFVGEPADVDSSDFNNITNDGGGTLVEWGASLFPTLGDYQASAPHDDNSVSKAVTFVDQANGDLHLSGSSIGDADLAGAPIADVGSDIDGETRSSIAPYMGADEGSTPLALGIAVDLDVLLEGPYSGSAMDAALNDYGHLDGSASSHPFSSAPWAYSGSESVAAGFFAANPTVVDWVLCVLYSGSLPSVTPVDTIAAFVLEDGTVVSHTDGSSDPFFEVAAGTYHLAVFARNHLGVISASQVDLSLPSPAYDFTDGLSKAYGVSAMQDLGGGAFGLYAGDADADGQVIANDFNAWLTDTKAGATGYLAPDYNMDGQVNAADFNVWLANTKAGAASQIP